MSNPRFDPDGNPKRRANVGDLWRKHGTRDWFRIARIDLPGVPGYDGRFCGVAIDSLTLVQSLGQLRRIPNGRWFIPAGSIEAFEGRARMNGNYPVYEHQDGEVECPARYLPICAETHT